MLSVGMFFMNNLNDVTGASIVNLGEGKSYNEKICTICRFNLFNNYQTVIVTQCDHRFHDDCFAKYAQNKIKDDLDISCCNCRSVSPLPLLINKNTDINNTLYLYMADDIVTAILTDDLKYLNKKLLINIGVISEASWCPYMQCMASLMLISIKAPKDRVEIVKTLYYKGKANICNIWPLSGKTSAILVAMDKNNMKTASFLIETGVDINAINQLGRTALIESAIYGNISITNALLKAGAEVDIYDLDMKNALGYAFRNKYVDIVKALIIANSDAGKLHGYIEKALINKDRDMAEVLVKFGVDVEADINKFGLAEMTNLYIAAGNGYFELVNSMIDKKADIYKLEPLGFVNVLCASCLSDNKALIEYLIDTVKIDINIKTKDVKECTPLYIAACVSSNLDMVKFIKSKGGIVYEDSLHMLAVNAFNVNLDMVNFMIDNGAKINFVEKKGYTPLHSVIINKNKNLLKILLDKKVDINPISLSGNTPIHMVTKENNGDIGMLKSLINNGADVNTVNKLGQTPLYNAIMNNYIDVAEYLIANKASVNVNDNSDKSIISMAVCKGILKNVKFLVNYGAYMFVLDYKKQSILYHAILNRHLDVAMYLVAKGSNINAVDCNGDTVLHLATAIEFMDLVILLATRCKVKLDENNMGIDTSFHCAARTSYINMVEFLISKGAYVNAVNLKGMTILHTVVLMAAKVIYHTPTLKRMVMDVIKLLVEHRAIVNTTDNYGDSPLHTAIKFKCQYIADILIDKGANIDKTN